MSVASLALSSGFSISEGGALNGLSALVKSKIQTLGKELKRTAESSKRKLVTVEDFAVCIPSMKEVLVVPSESLRQITGVPSFPHDSIAIQKPQDLNAVGLEADVKRISGLGSHFPALPAEHTYKRSKLDAPELTTAEIAELRRTQQKQSVLVRESLAKMREGSSQSNGEKSAL
jgi:hypothetical protein